MKQNLWDLFIWFAAVSLYLQLAIFLTTVFFLSIMSFTLRIYSASQRLPISIHRLVASNYTCVISRSHVKLRANSQHCWANNVGSCYVRVCSDLQTDARNPNIVGPTMLGVVASVLAVVCKRMQEIPILLGPSVHDGKDTTHKTLKTMCNAPAWPQQCWKELGKRIQPCYACTSAITEREKCWELLAKKFDRFQTLRNNSQQYATICNRVCKRTQYHERLRIFWVVVGQQHGVCLYIALYKLIERKRYLDCEWILFLLSGKLSSQDWPVNRYKMKKSTIIWAMHSRSEQNWLYTITLLYNIFTCFSTFHLRITI